MEDRVAQSGLLEAAHGAGAASERPDRRQTLHGVSKQNPVADDPEAAGTLRHEEVAFGREGHRERTHQAVGHLLHPEIVQRGPDDAVVVLWRVRTARIAPGGEQEEDG